MKRSRRFVSSALIVVLSATASLACLIGGGWLVVKRYDLTLVKIKPDAYSMTPLYPPGTIVLVRGDVQPHREDIIALQNRDMGGFTTHIFAGFTEHASECKKLLAAPGDNKGNVMCTKGLAVPEMDDFDPAPTKEDYKGRAVFATDMLTASFWHSLRGASVMLMFGVILLLAGTNELWKSRQEKVWKARTAAMESQSASTPV